MGYDPLRVSDEQFTTSSVISELHPNTTPYTRLELALETRKIKIYTPSMNALLEIENTSRKVGDFIVLSRADKDVLATTLDLARSGFSPKLVSDDYAVQNVAEFLGLKYISLTTFGIRYRFRWILYCPACKRKYAPDISQAMDCSVCGTPLKRKVLRKQAVKGKDEKDTT